MSTDNKRPPLRAGAGISRELILLGAILVTGLFFTLLSPYYLTQANLEQVLRNSVDLAILSAGMTLIIIMACIDVSVGGILAVAAILIGRSYQAGIGDAGVIVVGLSAGAFLGAVNGTVVAKARVPPIIATLGMMYIFLAVLFLVIGGRWIAGLPDGLSFLIRGSVLGIPAGVFLIAGVYGFSYLLLRGLRFGQHIYAIGSDEKAARLVGIPVDRVKILTYTYLGLLAGLAAVLYVARLRNVEVNIGTAIALEAIAAVILGGARINGGVGSLLGTLLGVIFIKSMQNGLVLIGVSSLWDTVVVGGLLITVLIFDAVRGRSRAREGVE